MPLPFDDITERVLKTFNVLLKNGQVRSRAQFCSLIGFSRHAFSMVENGERGFPAKHINNICTAFNISSLYLEQGKGKIFESPLFLNDKIKVLTFNIDTISKNHVKIVYTDITGINKTIELVK